MPFSPQPRKKGNPRPQDDCMPSCGHRTTQKNCPQCASKQEARAPGKVIDLPTEKKKIASLTEKISSEILSKEEIAAKAATVLSWWINRK